MGSLGDLRQYLTANSPHIVTLQETMLGPTNRIYFPNYTCHRVDRPLRNGGGVAILVRRDIRHHRAPTVASKPFELCSIIVSQNETKIQITSLYSPTHTNTFKARLASLFATRNHFIFGDFNARHNAWNDSKSNRAGNELFDLQLSNGIIVVHPDQHTYISPTAAATQSTIDHLTTNSTIPIGDINRIDDLFSDHWAFSVTIGMPPPSQLPQRLDFRNANWAAYAYTSTLKFSQIQIPNTIEEINTAVTQITEAIHNACDIAVPRVTVKFGSHYQADDTIAAIRELRRLKNQWNRNRHSPAEPQIRSLMHRAKALLAQLLERDRHSNWSKLTEKLGDNTQKCWKLAKKIRGGSSTMPTLKSQTEGEFIIDEAAKAELMADEFLSYHRSGRTPVPADNRIINRVKNFVKQNTDTPADFEPIDAAELTAVWKAFRPFKSPGIDRVLAVALKKLPIGPKCLIIAVFNKCLELRYWPENWKMAKVVCVPKRGKPANLQSSYRPISLLSTLSKTLERIVANRMEEHLTTHNILQPHQFGFRRQHSAVQQALRIKNHVIAARDRRQSTGLVLLDVKNAFPSVWVDGLISKMLDASFPSYLVSAIYSFCSDRKYFVQIGSGKSIIKTTSNGTPQGSACSPILYAFFIADMKLPKGVTVALFADDTTFMAHSIQHRGIATRLRTTMKSIKNYCHRWRISLNTNKTETILFPLDGKRKRKPPNNEIMFNPPPKAYTDDSDDNMEDSPTHDTESVIYSQTVRYLGVNFDSKLLFGHHIDLAVQKATGATMALYPLLASNSKLPTKTKLLLYKQIVRPIFTYGSPVWSSAAKCHLKRLQVVQNRALKIIFKLPRRHPTIELHQRSGMPMVADYLLSLNISFRQRCHESKFSLIRSLV